MPQDLVARESVGLASGIVNMGGQIAGFVIPLIVGFLTLITGSFFSGFIVMGIGAVMGAVVMVFVKEPKRIETEAPKGIPAK